MEQFPKTEDIESPEQSPETEKSSKEELIALMKEHAKTGDHIDGGLVIKLIKGIDNGGYVFTEADFDKIIKYSEKAIEKQKELRKAGNGRKQFDEIINHIRWTRGWDRPKK